MEIREKKLDIISSRMFTESFSSRLVSMYMHSRFTSVLEVATFYCQYSFIFLLPSASTIERKNMSFYLCIFSVKYTG